MPCKSPARLIPRISDLYGAAAGFKECKVGFADPTPRGAGAHRWRLVSLRWRLSRSYFCWFLARTSPRSPSEYCAAFGRKVATGCLPWLSPLASRRSSRARCTISSTEIGVTPRGRIARPSTKASPIIPVGVVTFFAIRLRTMAVTLAAAEQPVLGESTRRTDTTGMISTINIYATATKFIVAFCLAASAVSVRAQDAPKKAAMDWAVEHRAEVVDAIMGVPTHDTVDADTGSFSVRSPGFEDKFEFSITVVKTESGGVSGTVALPEREPITVQLARLRERGALSLAECIKQVRVIRRPLSPNIARRIAARLANQYVPIAPVQTNIVLDRRRFEVAGAAWSDLRLTIVDDPHAKEGSVEGSGLRCSRSGSGEGVSQLAGEVSARKWGRTRASASDRGSLH